MQRRRHRGASLGADGAPNWLMDRGETEGIGGAHIRLGELLDQRR
jgi:hypothetical protein